ncbi:flavodoxin family protein [Wukongibacter baidiensis]|uniref:flavodoxin family protein n=1 Tax=Wukongibacter baidiensis TaxID=1723361 RepID=UPI003D7F2588
MEKKWLAIIGSPRKGQNTELLTDYVIEGLNEKNISVKKYYLDSKNISTCNACEYCIKESVCNIEDSLGEIINEMKSADGYILASPSYNYNVTAQMKALLDRTFSLNDYTGGIWSSRLSPDKKAIIIGVCKGKTEESMGYTMEAMRKSIDELGVKVIDMIGYYNTKYKPVEDNKEIREEIVLRVRNYVELLDNK